MVLLKLKTHERAKRHSDGDQFQTDGVIEEVTFGKSEKRPAFAGGPSAGKKEGASNTDKNAHQMRSS
ncbi:MAG: hypothetical protein DCF16_17550 [Alphaproteobacteria bacterium]|nr:MAG: hypothetical protein DCF16_17550 [Alphaproteobacteria bacterium]